VFVQYMGLGCARVRNSRGIRALPSAWVSPRNTRGPRRERGSVRIIRMGIGLFGYEYKKIANLNFAKKMLNYSPGASRFAIALTYICANCL